MPSNFFKDGSWNALCDVCSFKFKSGDLKKRWDGLLVCQDDWELDHPQKYLRVRETGVGVEPVRQEGADVFIEVCTIVSSSGYAGLGQAGCMRAGNNLLPYQFLLNIVGGLP